MNRDVAQIRRIGAVGHRTAGADQPAAVEHEAFEHAVGVDAPQMLGALVAERGDPVELGQRVPVDARVLARRTLSLLFAVRSIV